MMKWQELWKQVEWWELEKVVFPEGLYATTLAKVCYMWWCEEEGIGDGVWREPKFKFYDALDTMLSFIGSVFVGGREWVTDSTISAYPEKSHYRLYELLDKSGLFSRASRHLMDFVVRGSPTILRRKTYKIEVHQLEM